MCQADKGCNCDETDIGCMNCETWEENYKDAFCNRCDEWPTCNRTPLQCLQERNESRCRDEMLADAQRECEKK